MDAAEQFRQKNDFSKAGQYLDATITEIEKLANQRPVPRLTPEQRSHAGWLVNYAGNLAASQNIAINLKQIGNTPAVNTVTADNAADLAKAIAGARDSANQQSERIRQDEQLRYRRIGSAFRLLFGPQAEETKRANNMLDVLQKK